jgi:hypothetical protein
VLTELARRGYDVVYSDADVVWRHGFYLPHALALSSFDVAFQVRRTTTL